MSFFSRTLRAAVLILAGAAVYAAAAQTPVTPQTVALAPDTCPVVHPEDTITFDWNPGFSPAYAITAVNALVLRFRRPAFVTGGHLDRPLVVLSPLPLRPVAPGPNGFFHFELKIQGLKNPSGEYYVYDAEPHLELSGDYTGDAPVMTNSPATARLCIRYENPTGTRSSPAGR